MRTTLVWEFRGRTAAAVTCWLSEASSGDYRVTVLHGEVEMMIEHFRSGDEAVVRASMMGDELKRFGWFKLPKLRPS